MCYYQNGFLCCTSLYYGCVIIGISGVIFSIVGLVVVITKLVFHTQVWAILALIFLIIYFVAKVILLLGTTYVSF